MREFVTRESLASADFLQGALILVDKSEDWTSFDVVNKLRGTLRHVYGIKKIKVGHAGTLDPFATGLLIICTGKLTPALHTLQGLDKEYTGEMILGASTASYDRETPPEDPKPIQHISAEEIREVARQFTGTLSQIPPMYSAIKKDGKALYELARKGRDIEREPRSVQVHAFEIISIEMPSVHFRVVCSKGTYIRSLAHDFGQRLGCGAYLNALRRTKIGAYRVEDAWDLDVLIRSLEDMRRTE